jgi:hypothetical protein
VFHVVEEFEVERTGSNEGCFIGFTGTPLMKGEKITAVEFGGLIEPSYTIDQAVKDKAQRALEPERFARGRRGEAAGRRRKAGWGREEQKR